MEQISSLKDKRQRILGHMRDMAKELYFKPKPFLMSTQNTWRVCNLCKGYGRNSIIHVNGVVSEVDCCACGGEKEIHTRQFVI